jgi:hypothetical protein
MVTCKGAGGSGERGSGSNQEEAQRGSGQEAAVKRSRGSGSLTSASRTCRSSCVISTDVSFIRCKAATVSASLYPPQRIHRMRSGHDRTMPTW